MLDSISPLLETLITKHQEKSEESSLYSHDIFIPSLRKLRKLAGMPHAFTFCSSIRLKDYVLA